MTLKIGRIKLVHIYKCVHEMFETDAKILFRTLVDIYSQNNIVHNIFFCLFLLFGYRL